MLLEIRKPVVTLFETKKVSNAQPVYDNYIGKMYSLSNTGRPNLNFDTRHAPILFNCGSSTPLSFGRWFLSGNICLEGLSLPEIFGFMHRSIPAAPMPPPPGHCHFLLDGKFPVCAKCPKVGRKEEGKCPAPGNLRPQSTLQQFSFNAQ